MVLLETALWTNREIPWKIKIWMTTEVISRQKMRTFKVCHSLTVMDWDSLQNTLALGAHLLVIWDTDSRIWFAWSGILRGRETFMPKLFQKWILGDTERGFEHWSPRSQSCHLITSYFGESTSSSAGAIPLCINSVRRSCLDSWWLGNTLRSPRRDSNPAWTPASW